MDKRLIFRISLLLFFLEDAALGWILERKIAQGTSLQPILVQFNHGLVVLVGLVGLGSLALFFLDLQGSRAFPFVQRQLKKKAWKWGLLALFAVVLTETVQDLLVLGSAAPKIDFPIYLVESRELFYWAGLVSLQAIIVILALDFSGQIGKDPSPSLKWLPWAVVGFGLLGFVFLTGSGYLPYSSRISELVGYFTSPNAPLMLSQVVIIWLLVSLFWLAWRWILKRWGALRTPWAQILAFILLWTIAFSLWTRVPLFENYFLQAPQSPDAQFIVTSDSVYYEIQAHRFLVGEGFAEDVQHPLYSYFLSGLHFLGGDGYEDIYRLQIALLAVGPFLLYLLAKELSSDYGGWIAGGLFIIREYNGLLVGDSITVSTVNLLMTESLTALGVILALYLMINWLKKESSRPALIGLIGGVIGLLMLLRVELLSLLLAFSLVIIGHCGRNWRSALGKIALMAAVAGLVVLPWMSRNWVKTGDFSLDKGRFFQRVVSSYVSKVFGPDEITAGEDPTITMEPDQPRLGLIEKVWRHTKNNLVQSFLYLPDNHQLFLGLDNYLKIIPEKSKIVIEPKGYFSDAYLTTYVKSLPYWQRGWDGKFAPQSLLPLTLSFGLVLAGFYSVWKRSRSAALLPLIVLGFHSVVYGIFSRSGGRFIQVVDWIPLMYFSGGISVLSGWLGERVHSLFPFKIEEQSIPPLREGRTPDWLLTAAAVGCVLIAASMPVSEALLRPRYTEASLQERLETVSSPEEVELSAPGEVLLYGKALYPAFYRESKTVADDRSGRLPPADDDRLVLYLVGMDNIWVSLPADSAPGRFPNGTEVIIRGVYDRTSLAEQQAGKYPYFLADQIYMIKPNRDGGERLAPVLCGDTICYR